MQGAQATRQGVCSKGPGRELSKQKKKVFELTQLLNSRDKEIFDAKIALRGELAAKQVFEQATAVCDRVTKQVSHYNMTHGDHCKQGVFGFVEEVFGFAEALKEAE